MKAVILAAGRGVRMRPFTNMVPKVLLKIGGKTFLDHILSALPPSANEIIIVVGHKKEKIIQYIGHQYGSKKVIYVTQRQQKGTGGALMLTKSFFKKYERFFIFYGDEPPTRKEVQACLKHRYSWMCRVVTDPAVPVGVVQLDKKGVILKVTERPIKQIRPCVSGGGVFLVDTDIFDYNPIRHRTGEYYLTSMMNKFLKHHRVYATWGKKDLYFNSPKDLDRFSKLL